jgi:hypothetical protein
MSIFNNEIKIVPTGLIHTIPGPHIAPKIAPKTKPIKIF